MAIVAAGLLAANDVCQAAVVVNSAAISQGQTSHSNNKQKSKDPNDNMDVQVKSTEDATINSASLTDTESN